MAREVTGVNWRAAAWALLHAVPRRQVRSSLSPLRPGLVPVCESGLSRPCAAEIGRLRRALLRRTTETAVEPCDIAADLMVMRRSEQWSGSIKRYNL